MLMPSKSPTRSTCSSIFDSPDSDSARSTPDLIRSGCVYRLSGKRARRKMMENPYTCSTELDELRPDDTIIDYSAFCDDNFVLIALLTSNGEAQAYFETGREKPRKSVVHVRSVCSTSADPVTVCIGSHAAFVLFGLSDGNLLVMPIKMLIDVTWGGSSWNAVSVVELPAPSVDVVCLATPTCVRCFTANFPPRTLAVVANKAGNILLVDLLIRKCVVELRAPQSVHRIDILKDENSVELLVTGYTGAQWVIPLERNGRGVAEVLTTCVPADLQQLEPVTSQFFTSDNNVVALDVDESQIEVYPTINSIAHMSKRRYKVPPETWLVHFTDSVLFTASNDTELRSAVHLGFPNLRLEYSLVKNAPTWRPLGMVSLPRRHGRLPGVFLVNERGLVRIEHNANSSLPSVAAEFLFRLPSFSAKSVVDVADVCHIDGAELQRTLIPTLLENRRRKRLSRTELSRIVGTARLINLDLLQLVGMFEQNGVEEQLLPEVLLAIERGGFNKTQKLQAKVVDLFVKKANDGDVATKREADAELSNFLAKFDVQMEGAERCLQAGLWRSATTLASRQRFYVRHYMLDTPLVSGNMLRYVIKEGHKFWRHANPTDRLQMVSTVCQLDWTPLDESDVSRLCALLSAWQRDISTPTYHEICLRTAKLYSELYAKPCNVLYLVSAMYILADSRHDQTKAVPMANPLNASLNCGAAITSDERVLIWGDYSSLQQKPIETGQLGMKTRQANTRVIGNGITPGEAASTSGAIPAATSVSNGSVASKQNLPRELACPGGRPRAIACGAEHVLVLTTSGQLYAWGGNRYGQCGVGHCFRNSDLQLIEGKWPRIMQISAGQYHSAFVCDDGSLWMFGWGFYGQLGMGGRSNRDYHVPAQVPTLNNNVASVACGRVHSVALTADGELFVTGGGSYGQMGCDADVRKTFEFSRLDIHGGLKVKKIATNYYHSMCVTEGDRVFEWGRNPQEMKMRMFVMRRLKRAQLKSAEEVRVDSAAAFAAPLKQSLDLPMDIPRSDLGLREVKHLLDGEIQQISTGLSHSALVTANGSLYTWGKSLEYQLGNGNKGERGEPHQVFEPTDVHWSLVRCGNNHTVAATDDGRVYAWGRNDFAQCGIVSEKPTTSNTRKLVFQPKDGSSRRTIPLPDDSLFVSQPIIVPNVYLRMTPAADRRSAAALDEDELMRKIRNTDVATVQAVSNHLYTLKPDVVQNGVGEKDVNDDDDDDRSDDGPLCTTTALVHLMAGDVLRAIRIISKLKRQNTTNHQSLMALSSLVWEVVANHVDVQTRAVLTAAFRDVPMADSMRRGKQIAQLWPMVWDDPDAQAALSVDEKIAMLDAFTAPSRPVTSVTLPSSALNVASRVRVFAQCAHAEPAMTGTPPECSACLDEWTEKVRATLGAL